MTKASLYSVIEARVRAAGGELRNTGGDCYTAIIRGEARLMVALKETRSEKKPWVGVPVPVLQMLTGRRSFADETPSVADIERVFIVLSHIPAKTLLVIPISSVLKVIVDRAQATASPNVPVQFHLTKRGYRDYVIRNDRFRSAIPVQHFSLDPLWSCLQ